MKKLLALTLLSLSFISCMEVRQPICNSSNRVDIQGLPSLLTLNLLDPYFEIEKYQTSLVRVGKGLYNSGGQAIVEVCSVAGKTIFQSKTEFNTYKIFSYSIGKDNLSFPTYFIDKKHLDNHAIPYGIVYREPDARFQEVANSLNTQGHDTLVVDHIPQKLIPELITLAPNFSFGY